MNIGPTLGDSDSDEESGIATAHKEKVQPPRKYKVLLMNDDYTTMEFVVHILKKYFNKTATEAQQVMLQVHAKGFGICGVYTFEVAETKVAQVTKYSKKNGHPLKCACEPCDS
jgi:ATP-dependent Clp protease adaptor protein ClpS